MLMAATEASWLYDLARKVITDASYLRDLFPPQLAVVHWTAAYWFSKQFAADLKKLSSQVITQVAELGMLYEFMWFVSHQYVNKH